MKLTQTPNRQTFFVYVISGFRLSVYEIFILLGCYAAYIGSYRRFETTYRSHLQVSSSQRLLGASCLVKRIQDKIKTRT